MKTDELKACAGCKAVFYCSKGYQTYDWKNRHKVLCMARKDGADASKKASSSEKSGSGGAPTV